MAPGTVARIEPDKVVGVEFDEYEFEYTERDVALYALGVGAASADACDPIDLPFVCKDAQKDQFRVLPTFAVLFPSSLVDQLLAVEGLKFDPALLLHGEQYLQVHCSLPARAKVVNRARISAIKDKGKSAVVDVETVSFDRATGDRLATNRSSIVLRGAGGFTKPNAPHLASPPHRQAPELTQHGPATSASAATSRSNPDATVEERIPPSQALLYGLSGDYNPLHSDPKFAASAGFPRPILHGLCTLGFATRAILRTYCLGNPSLFHSVHCRFRAHVFPGETLRTQMWKGDGSAGETRISFECWIVERGLIVLSGLVQLQQEGKAEQEWKARL